jgi:glycosyltransferase involved in cell wall biosynthesis
MNAARAPLKISIVVPCRNAAPFISKTLLSIRKQDYANTEVIVVDGLSSDDTLQIVRGFSGLEIRVISEADQGQLDALQKGLKAAGGDILYWLNADDVLMPGTLEFVSRVFAADPGLDLVFSDDFAFQEEQRLLSVGATIRHFTFAEHVLFYRQLYSECVFWRAAKTRLLPAEFFKLRACTDYAFFVNLRRGLREKWVPKRLGAFRVVSNQASKRFGDRVAEERAFIRQAIYADLGWSGFAVRAHQVLWALPFFTQQYLYPRWERGWRKLQRLLSGDRSRRAMTAQFFDVWLNESASNGQLDAALLDR